MNIVDKNMKKDDTLLFAEELKPSLNEDEKKPPKFKLLIVDDENEIHIMTRLVLSDYSYNGATLEFLSAYSGKDAKQLIKAHPDAACMLLDVVMENNEAGLEVARFIREEEKNDKIRIILRTGQPGKAPEKNIILNYDINDYKEKTELTTQKLFTSITTALRSYIHLVDLEKKTKEIADKNLRLNEEIARRIVAESNLTKYNRSLEKMIDNKSARLKTAIAALKIKEKELREAHTSAAVGDISLVNVTRLNVSGDQLKQNLSIMDKYRIDMTLLLEKYETLQNLITPHSNASDAPSGKTRDTLKDINQLKKEIDLDEILTKYPEIIKDSTKGIDQISEAINDIQSFISIKDEPLKNTDINSLLKKVSSELQKTFGSKIGLQTDFSDIPNIRIAEKNIKKAFHEIIKNAFEAMPSKGIVSVSTSCTDSDITILISDIGQGIYPEHMDYVFKSYFSIHKPHGKGLGLSFARSAVLSSNGTIHLTSTRNEGTNITITFPIKPDEDLQI
ncbi:MAG: ATP-binding protein [Desulfobacula sp.]|jgi:signal transduction histidine kinase